MVIRRDLLPTSNDGSPETWINQLGGKIVAEKRIQVLSSAPPSAWLVVHFNGLPTLEQRPVSN
jgi:hypothetical protein